MRERWGFWDWVGYTGIFIAAAMLAYEAARHATSPDLAATLPALLGGWLGFLPLGLLLLSGIVFLFQRLGILPHGGRRQLEEIPGTRFAWRNKIPLVPHVGRHFQNERVILDGCAFSHCTFKNVTFVYNGTAIFHFADNEVSGSFHFSSENPSVVLTFAMLRGFGLLPGVNVETGPHSVIEPPQRSADEKPKEPLSDA